MRFNRVNGNQNKLYAIIEERKILNAFLETKRRFGVLSKVSANPGAFQPMRPTNVNFHCGIK
jgi:hypothetical protein